MARKLFRIFVVGLGVGFLVWLPDSAQASKFGVDSFVAKGNENKLPSASNAVEKGAASFCDGAIDLELGSSYSGTTIGLPDRFSSYPCSEYDESGGEIVFRLEFETWTMIDLTLRSDCDLDLALYLGCEIDRGCVLVADTGITTTRPVLGEFYVIVDGYQGAACDFTLELTEIEEDWLDPQLCASEAAPTACGSETIIVGNTCDFEDRVRSLSCSYSEANGKDQWFQFTVQHGGIMDVTLSMAGSDAILWVLDGCGDRTNCVRYSDIGFHGESESVSFENHSGERSYYVVVDSYEADSCAEFRLELHCSGVRVSNTETSWSALKARFAPSPPSETGGGR